MKTKTWKRETAVTLLAVLGYVVIGEKDVEMVKVIVWPVLTFAGLAFGLDWHGKRVRQSYEDTPDGRY